MANASSFPLSYCRAPCCQCPDFDSLSPTSDHPCQLCDHHRLWHLQSVVLTSAEIEARGRGLAMEKCKSSGCECPIWVGDGGRLNGEGVDCFLCGHRRGWHVASFERALAREQQRRESEGYSTTQRSPSQDTYALSSSPPRRPLPSVRELGETLKAREPPRMLPQSFPSTSSITTPPSISVMPGPTASTTVPPRTYSSTPSSTGTDPSSASSGMPGSSAATSPASTELESPYGQPTQLQRPTSSGTPNERPVQPSNTIYMPPAPPRVPSPHSLPQITTNFPPPRPLIQVPQPQRPHYAQPVPMPIPPPPRRVQGGPRPQTADSGTARPFGAPPVTTAEQYNSFSVVANIRPQPIPPSVPHPGERLQVNRMPTVPEGSFNSSQAAIPNRRASDPISPSQSIAPSVASSVASTSSSQRRPSKSTQWETHASKNIEFSMCPPLSTTVVSPGDVIRCKVRLSSKVAISDYDKLDITFLGVSTVAGEPPEIHTFVQVMKSVLPRGADVKTEGMANREWSFQFEVPHQMNCACRGSSLAIPPTYRHDEVLIKYSIELMGKRKQRFSANDKLSVPLVVQRLGPDPVISTAELGVDVGTDDIWKFVRASKKNKGSSYLILVEGQRAPITDAEIAYHVVKPGTSTSTVYVNYRFSLHHPANSSLSKETLTDLMGSLRISLSRRILIRKISAKGKDRDKETLLPALRIPSKIKKVGVKIVSTEVATIWRMEGRIETSRDEVMIWNSCNAEVRFVLSAHLAHTTLSSDISAVIPINDFRPIEVVSTISDAQSIRSVGSRRAVSTAPTIHVRDRSSSVANEQSDVLNSTVTPFRMSSNPPVPPLPDTQSLYAMDTRSLRGTPDGRRSIDNRSIAENGSIINGNGGYASSFTGVQMAAEPYGNQIPVQPVQPVTVPMPQPVPQPQIQPQAQPAPANPQNWDSDFSQFMSQAAAEHLPPPLYHNAVHDAPYHLNQS